MEMPEWAQDWATGTGKRIREARLEKGWSQEGLSRAAVVSYTTVEKLRKRPPDCPGQHHRGSG